MADSNYSTDNLVVTLNGRILTQWGQGIPVNDTEIDPDGALVRGLGGTVIRFDRTNPGRQVVLNVAPGTPDSAYVQGLRIQKANLTLSVTQVSTLENKLGTKGMFLGKGSSDRGDANFSDDSYTMAFGVWVETAGGDD